jgi:hypothetical protein
MNSGPSASTNDPSPSIVATRTGMPSTGSPVAVVYDTYMTHCFASDSCVTIHEPVTASLLCSDRTPTPKVVVAAAVVVASDGNTVGVDVPRSAAPTIDPCPGSAWLISIGEGIERDGVRAAAKLAESQTRRVTMIDQRRNFIKPLV